MVFARVGVEPAHHLVPLGLEKRLGPNVNVGKEGHAHALLSDLLVFVFQREVRVIDVEDVPGFVNVPETPLTSSGMSPASGFARAPGRDLRRFAW